MQMTFKISKSATVFLYFNDLYSLILAAEIVIYLSFVIVNDNILNCVVGITKIMHNTKNKQMRGKNYSWKLSLGKYIDYHKIGKVKYSITIIKFNNIKTPMWFKNKYCNTLPVPVLVH